MIYSDFHCAVGTMKTQNPYLDTDINNLKT